MSFIGDEDYDFERHDRYGRRRPSPHRMHTETRRSQYLLNPAIDHGGLYRTRSQGHGPVPVVNVYNDVIADSHPSVRSPSPYAPYPPSPESRGRRTSGLLGDGLADEIAELSLENRRLRSRSRGRSDVGFSSEQRSDDFYRYELRRRERELRESEQRDRLEKEYETQKLKDDLKRKADEQHEKDERKRIIDEYERKKREDEEDAKEAEIRLKEKIDREKREAKEKEEREYEEFLIKKQQKEDKEKREKKEHEEELEKELRERLYRAGYSNREVERVISDEKEKTTKKITTTTTTRTSNALTPFEGSRAPVYAKIHRDYLSVDTLKYYDIPWEYDKKDRNYIIVLREMDKVETDILFEHTRRLRGGKTQLLLEPEKKKPQYAWYRKRDRSTSRVRKVGILEYEDSRRNS